VRLGEVFMNKKLYGEAYYQFEYGIKRAESQISWKFDPIGNIFFIEKN